MSALSLNNIPLSTSSPTPLTSLQTYFKDRAPDVRKLSDALKAGDLNAAKQAYNNLVSLSNSAIDGIILSSDPIGQRISTPSELRF